MRIQVVPNLVNIRSSARIPSLNPGQIGSGNTPNATTGYINNGNTMSLFCTSVAATRLVNTITYPIA